jgi:integration host factor subunit beta
MTKSDLIQHLAEKKKMTWQHAEVLVEAVFACMEQSLRRGERIEIRGFGTFQVRSYRGYKGRNPKTGDVVDVALEAHRALVHLSDAGRLEFEPVVQCLERDPIVRSDD